MPRAIPKDRYEALIDAACQVFIEQGYRRTQMADVAARLGVAKGTLYLYVASKAALFHESVRHADHTEPIPLPEVLPVPTPAPGETIAMIQAEFQGAALLPQLEAALARRRVTKPKAEILHVLGETYDLLAQHRTAIELFDACATDRPEIATVWYAVGRRGAMSGLDTFLQDRARRGYVRTFPDPAAASRLVLETLTFWAVHRHWDPSPQAFDEEQARATVLEFLCAALLTDA